MIGLGTIANTLAVIIGSGIGLMIKSGLKPRYQETIMQALGLSTLFIGVSGAMSGMLKIIDNGIETQGSMLLIGSLVFGALLGEFLNIELRLEQAGEWLKKKVHIKNDNTFVEGFVTATLVICVGAMAVVGALQDGLQGDVSTLFAKSVLDFVIVMVFASTLGVGVTFSALPLLIYQGSITLFASFLKSFLSPIVIANLLPAMIIPFLFH